MAEPDAKEIVETLSEREKAMILAGQPEHGGSGVNSWEHVFASDRRFWELHMEDQHFGDSLVYRMTPLAKSVQTLLAG